jgi:hypothetical protein
VKGTKTRSGCVPVRMGPRSSGCGKRQESTETWPTRAPGTSDPCRPLSAGSELMASTVPPCARVHVTKLRCGGTRPEKSQLCRDGVVLVNETTEHVTAADAKRSGGGGGSVAWQRHAEVESSVRTMFVVVLDVLAENRREVTTAEHEHPVEAFGSDRPDLAFRERVGPR